MTVFEFLSTYFTTLFYFGMVLLTLIFLGITIGLFYLFRNRRIPKIITSIGLILCIGAIIWFLKTEIRGGIGRQVDDVVFSSDEKILAIGISTYEHAVAPTAALKSATHEVKLWDLNTRKCLITFSGSGDTGSIAISPDGKFLASGGLRSNSVNLWNLATKQEQASLQGHTNSIWSVAFSPDGKKLGSGSLDNTIMLWDVVTGKPMLTFKDSGGVTSIAFSPDGKTLASGSKDATIKLWDTVMGKRLMTFRGHTSGVVSVAFSPDGKLLASGGWDKMVKVWDVATGQEKINFAGHTGTVRSVKFSPNKRILASGSDDNTVKLWDSITEQEIMTIIIPGEEMTMVSSVAFSPDGKIIATGSGYEGFFGPSGSYSGTVRLWDVATGKQQISISHNQFKILDN